MYGKYGLVFLLLSSLMSPDWLEAQDYGSRLGVQRGGRVSYEPRGPGVLFDALDPTLKRWYVPQELYNEYRWRAWQYNNYARENYQRYVNTAIEGNYFYDLYGNFVTQGWLIYDMRRQQPAEFGSTVFKDSRYGSWFNNVLIASDSKGQNHYAVTIGNSIRTTLTPLTFSKPAFNGIQADFASDKYQATVLMSRISAPNQVGVAVGAVPTGVSNTTDFLGGHFTAQVGDFVTLGTTYINAHQSNTLLESFLGGRAQGDLTVDQNSSAVTRIEILLEDDSPADGRGGAALFSQNIIITAIRDFNTGERETVTGKEINFAPLVQGGFQRQGGFLAADGDETIRLIYDFSDRAYLGPDPSTIVEVTFELVLANDYKVSMASNRQLSRAGEFHPLLIARADGNVRDTSNQRLVRFDYGLPTANQIFGFHLATTSFLGFDTYAEYAVNHQFRKYPNPNVEGDHESASRRADAWMLNAAKNAYPWFVYGEAFSMGKDYATSIFLSDQRGVIDYATQNRFFEFVEDNDDQDRTPDWGRAYQAGPDIEVFPGWDENNDFINDFNQNDNRTRENQLPDYEEPFLRYHSDRPEFLFGIDLNNNGWIDRFENDTEPDFPYKRDHRGYNAYGGVHLTPETRLTAGRTRQWLISSARRSETSYALFTFDKDIADLGRIRVFEHLKRARDNIADDRIAPLPFFRGPQLPVQDVLAARDTWINTVWLGFSYTGTANLTVENKFKYEFFHQLLDDEVLAELGARRDSRFFGLINKAEYSLNVAGVKLMPRVKSEYLIDSPFLRSEDERKQWTPSLFFITRLPLMPRTQIEAGLEQSYRWELLSDEGALIETGAEGVGTGDQRETILAIQATNISDYLGYKLITQLGFQYERRAAEIVEKKTTDFGLGNRTSTGFTTFITVYAGLGL